MGNRPIDEFIVVLIQLVWFDLKDKLGRNPTAPEVMEAAQYELDQTGHSAKQLPSRRKTEYVIQELREAYEGIPDSERLEERGLYQLWSIGALKDHPIDAGALPAVLRVKKFCATTTIASFTIHAAQWVARLYPVIDDVFTLWLMSRYYALEERRCAILKLPFDTSALDAALIMRPWELQTARLSRGVPFPSSGEYPDAPRHSPFPAWQARITPLDHDDIDGKIVANDLEGLIAHNFGEGSTDLLKKISGIDWAELSLSGEAGFVYGHWLSMLYDGAKWSELSADEQFGIFRRLREWVVVHPCNYENEEYTKQWKELQEEFGVHCVRDDIAPWHLIEEAGFIVTRILEGTTQNGETIHSVSISNPG